MNRQPHSPAREIVVAEAIREVVSELRMIDVADYIAYLRLEHFGNLSDLVDAASELYLMPGTLRFGHGGEASVCWSGEPRISLDLQLRPKGATVYFTLSLSALKAGVDVTYVAFDEPSDDPAHNTRFLATALAEARLRKPEPLDL